MSFDRPVPTDQPVPSNQRTVFLEALGGVVRTISGLTAEVGRASRGGTTVLRVANAVTGRSEDVACDMTADGWWFVWIDGGEIGPVHDLRGAGAVIGRRLGLAIFVWCGH